jgi:hypothetical protein
MFFDFWYMLIYSQFNNGSKYVYRQIAIAPKIQRIIRRRINHEVAKMHHCHEARHLDL